MALVPERPTLTGFAAHRFLRISEPSTCVFCGGSPVTKEHVWSDWLRAHIPRHMRKWSSYKATEYSTGIESAARKRPGAVHDWQVRCVCQDCNTGWMSRLENKIKPILGPLVDGQCGRLSEQDQYILATWITLKVMIAEFDNPERVTVHHMQRKMMKRRQQPPKFGWRIWISRYDRDQWIPHYINNTLNITPATAPLHSIGAYIPVKRYNTQSVTLVIGKLFVHVIHSTARANVRLFRFPEPAGTKLRRIWPISGYSIKWPPAIMSDDEADQAAGAFLLECRTAICRQRGIPWPNPRL